MNIRKLDACSFGVTGVTRTHEAKCIHHMELFVALCFTDVPLMPCMRTYSSTILDTHVQHDLISGKLHCT